MSTPQDNPLRYYLYARKSSESAERQMISIPSQIETLKSQFPHIRISEIIVESKSAFIPNNRPEFEKMLDGIKNNEADGIITWHPDRLSRNEIDAANITYLVRKGIIKDMKFSSYNFDSSPEGIMMLQMTLSQSQYYSSKLSKDVKRGLLTKLKSGWRPNAAPQGYMNDYNAAKGMKTIMIDPERYHLIEKAWGKMQTGLYSLGQIQKCLSEWGYLTRKTKHMGGKQLSTSGVQRMFRNKFYAGILNLPDGTEVKGKHKQMVTKKQFDKVQDILTGKNVGNRNHSNNLEFDYKALLTCGECEGTITAVRKYKALKKGGMNEYVYYYCTKNRHPNCSQKALNETKINDELASLFKRIMIHPILKAWGVIQLKEKLQEELDKANALHNSQKSSIEVLEKKKHRLSEKFVDDLLDKDDFIRMKKDINKQISAISNGKNEIAMEAKAKFKKRKKALTLLTKGSEILEPENLIDKKEFLQELALNFFVIDQNLVPVLKKWVINLQDFQDKYKSKIDSFEPKESYTETDFKAQNMDMYSYWRGVVNDI